MRDAFGGVFTMNLLLVFIFIFVAFSAVSLNYAKAFKLKNEIIDFIETNEIIDLSNMERYHGTLNNIIGAANYNKSCKELEDLFGIKITTNDINEGQEIKQNDQVIGYCYRGVYLSRKEKEIKEEGDKRPNNIKYNIQVAADWNLGALNKLLVLAGEENQQDSVIAGAWVIKGEATVVAKNQEKK